MTRTSNEIIERIGENVDRLITVDMHGRGRIDKLYPVFREKQKRPLTLLAAEKLSKFVRPGDHVIIATGLKIPKLLLPETDGPSGGAALARSLEMALGAKVIFATDEPFVDMMVATARGANLNVLPLDRLREVEQTVSVAGFPVNAEKAEEQAKNLIDEFDPKAVIAIERRGPNRKGIYHTTKGWDVSQDEGKVEGLFREAQARGILTIGIVDGCGTEIGYGSVMEAVEQLFPILKKCKCPCGVGLTNNTIVEVAIIASVSNWGAYGVSACLAALSRKLEVIHNKDIELRMIRECADTGAVDGLLEIPAPFVDRLPAELHASLVEMLREIVRNGLKL